MLSQHYKLNVFDPELEPWRIMELMISLFHSKSFRRKSNEHRIQMIFQPSIFTKQRGKGNARAGDRLKEAFVSVM
jgi:hypothetical protein